jgi:MarR family transcriptional regulator, organic hydroperoxide resistance regulator
VPHTDQPGTSRRSGASQESWELADCFSELIGTVVGQAEQLAQRMCVPSPFIKALHLLERPMAMKELGKSMHCDPSFVTLVADMLEKRGLARREPHLADRRVKNLVLTDDGLALKHRIEAEIVARMPWNRGLDDTERAQLLALIRKMLSAAKAGPDTDSDSDSADSDSADSDSANSDTAESDTADSDSVLVPDLHEDASPATSKPPVRRGR